ncbi:carbohydrate ABC transporter permease [Paenibacillus cymbidii]|uniref:carbohydrate ABC transporter permease n=1 Tax=Paenibacillus cymbidii TaxID=1639034 RepID=UPI001F28C7B1|nr:carbohydrate ABC transporter permease [Paenibacillus cymbidii]
MKKHSFAGHTFNMINAVLLTLLMIVCMYPFFYIFIYSISDPIQASQGLILLPKEVTLSNYTQILNQQMIGQAIFISVSRTIIGTFVTVLSCSLFAFTLTKNELPLRKWAYRFVIMTMYFNAGLIPWYLTMKGLGLGNNFMLYILPTAIVGFYVILLKTFFEQIPPALEECATVDGAGYYTIVFKIILPLSLPILATIAVFSAVNQWNTWVDNYFLVSGQKLRTLQMVLYDVLNQSEMLARKMREAQTQTSISRPVSAISPQSIRMTMTIIVTLPIIFVYPILQGYFVKGIMLGAVKG